MPSGTQAPEPEAQQGVSPTLVASVALLLYSPLAVLVIALCFVAHKAGRVSHKVLAATAAIYTGLYLCAVFLFGSTAATFDAYNAPLGRLFNALRKGGLGEFFADNWWFWVSSQAFPSIALGLCVAGGLTWWKHAHEPDWAKKDHTPGPLDRIRRKKTMTAIASDLKGPTDGRTLGVDAFGHRIVQTEAEGAAHTLIAGGSGSGKSTTMMIGIRDAIRRGEPVVVVDLKGAADLPEQMAEWCARYGRRFLHWSITDMRAGYLGPADGPAFYGPIDRGDPSRKKDLLIGSEKWDNEYYKSVNENYLQTAFKIAELSPNPNVDAFTDLTALLDYERLKARACAVFLAAPKDTEGTQYASANRENSSWWEKTHHVNDPYIADVLASAADMLIKPEDGERSGIRNMAARVQKLRQSTAGAWLKRDPDGLRDIDLRQVADEGHVVVFTLDSSNYEATSAQVGGLIIQDLKTLSSELRQKPAPTPMHVFVDEFSAIGSDNIIGLLARARDARMPTMLSTQALADLSTISDGFLGQVLGIVNCFILHRTNMEEDAIIFAGLTGKKNVVQMRYNVQDAENALLGGFNMAEDYVVSASGFQDLAVGELVYIAKSPKSRVVARVQVVRESPLLVAQAIAANDTPSRPAPVATVKTPFAVEDTTENDAAFPSPWPVMVPEAAAPQGRVAAIDWSGTAIPEPSATAPTTPPGNASAPAGPVPQPVAPTPPPYVFPSAPAVPVAVQVEDNHVPEIDFNEPVRPLEPTYDTTHDTPAPDVPLPPVVVIPSPPSLRLGGPKAAKDESTPPPPHPTPSVVPASAPPVAAPSPPPPPLPAVVAPPQPTTVQPVVAPAPVAVPVPVVEDDDEGFGGGDAVDWEATGFSHE